MMRWFSALSIRWKLQLSFFLVTLVTIVFMRWGSYQELVRLIEIARQANVEPVVLAQLDARRVAYLTNTLWQSALELLVLYGLISLLARRLVAPIESLCRVVGKIEQGDLTHTVENRSEDEIGKLARGFNAMQSGLTKIVRSIDTNSSQMAQSSYQVASISREITEVSQSENAVVEGMTQDAATLIEVAESVQHIAQEAIERATTASTAAQEGREYVGGNVSRMEDTVADVTRASDQVNELKGAAEQIYDIIGTIRAIAEQTNLLALNAAIEAARAGESGRGFAVVADEVRDLANRTTDSTGKITDIINQVNEQVGQVAESMEAVVARVNGSRERAVEAGEQIARIAEDISSAADSNQKIDEVSKNQLYQLQMLQIRLAGLFESVQQSSIKVATTGSVAKDLFRVSEDLRQELAQFTYQRDAQLEKDTNDKRAAPRLSHQLRVRFWQDGQQSESICSDLSLSGMKLRLSQRLVENVPLDLDIFLPYANLAEYENQRPVSVRGEIVWQREEAGQLHCGLRFIELDEERMAGLQGCFDFFHQAARYV